VCESTVLLKGDSGLSSVMVDAVRVVVSGQGCVCTDLMGRSVPLDDVRVAEIDLLRHRVILERT
jgi:predicted RNA-binding protein